VLIAFVGASSGGEKFLHNVSMEEKLSDPGRMGTNGYYLLGALFFAAMAFILWRTATNKKKMQ
jgi:hypothetical protein